MTEPDPLVLVGEMYGIQLDQLAEASGMTSRRAAAQVARWRTAGTAETAVLSPGPRWVWLTRAGLAVCGLPYRAVPPGLSRLAHLRAVTAARLAFAATPQVGSGNADWRSERRLRARIGGRIGLREHVPDAELLWPDGSAVPWAGESWALEAELTPKTATRTVAIMRELLTRTGDYGCLAAETRVPGAPPLHARAIYLCAPAALPVVSRARDALGALGHRVEIRLLPDNASLGSVSRAS
ncbi:MAG: hypothetical protein ACTHKL_14375 [Streptosporangiaceae bacterium]